MQEISLSFSDFQKSRYQAQTANNVPITQVITYSIARITWDIDLNITYSELECRLKRHFQIDESGASPDASTRLQQYRNHRSTLNGFLASVGKTTESRVGAELGSQFDRAREQYLELLDVSMRSKSDRRAHLKLVRLLCERPDSPARSCRFALRDALRKAIAETGVAPKTLAKRIGISPSAVQRWLAGAEPNRRGIPTLRRLERELGLARDTLTQLVSAQEAPGRNERVKDTATKPTGTVAHRERLRKCTERHHFILSRDEMSPEFIQEWRELLDYKTTSFPLLERHSRGTWRLIPRDTSDPLGELSELGDMTCPTAARCFEMVQGFLGVVLKLPSANGGLSFGETQPNQTLAWLSCPPALKAYIDHLTSKSGGIRHAGHRVFCAFAAGLLRPKSGYLWQRPEFGTKLPGGYATSDTRAWQELCEKSHNLLKVVQRNATGVSRSSTDPIAALLHLDNPLASIVQAIERIDLAAARAPSGGHRQALLKRDALLLGMLLSNPLRRRTMMSLTWNPQGTGSLRGSPHSGWRIELQANQLKNGASSMNRHYSVQVAEWLKPRLDAYIEEYRPTLLQGEESPYLFVCGQGKGIWKSLGKRVFDLTRNYIDDCPGFSPHAFRHLVATDWLTKHPNDFLTVSELLNDRLSTVIDHYAHLKRDNSFSRYEEHLRTML